jgi:uncharacterized protein YfaP (DUF2135 family)
VLPGDGSGAFSKLIPFPAGGAPACVRIADISGDKQPDLIVTRGGGVLSVLVAEGQGRFAPPQGFTAGSGCPTVRDWDGDRVPDLLVGLSFHRNLLR